MDVGERARYKQLANDSIIETFGTECSEQRLAQALEKCVDELADANDKCPTCSACEDHGNGDGIVINAEDITIIHRSLTRIVSKLKDSPVGLLAENLASLEDGLDELEELTKGRQSTLSTSVPHRRPPRPVRKSPLLLLLIDLTAHVSERYSL